MKRILFLGGLSTDDNATRTPYAQQLSKELINYEVDSLFFDDLLFHIAPDKFSISASGEELSKYNLVIFRGKIRQTASLAYIVSRYLVDKNINFFNDYSLYRPPSKLAQAALFYELKLPFIETLFSLNRQLMIEAARTELKFPIILKDNYGSHGANNFLIENKADLENKLKENSNVELILQTYHQNDCDYRVLVMGEREPLVIKRTAVSGSHLNNTSQGAKAELGHLPNDLLEQSKSLAKHLKMSVAGVDLLEDKNTHETFFLEVNSQPQLLTGAFVADKKQAFTSLIKDLI